MRSAVAAVALLLSLPMSPALARDFSEQQVWSYKTRKGEEGSTVLINKVENDPKLGQIFHISVAKVQVKNRRAPSGVANELPHFPVSKQTLEASCTKLVGKSAPNPDSRLLSDACASALLHCASFSAPKRGVPR